MSSRMPELSIEDLAPEALALLRHHNLLSALIKAEVVAEAVGGVALSEEQCDQLWNGYLSNHKIENDEQLASHLQARGLDAEALHWQLELPARCSSTAGQFKHKAELLSQRAARQCGVQPVARARRLLARELYLRIAGREANFADLAAEHSQGREAKTKASWDPCPEPCPSGPERTAAHQPAWPTAEPFRIEDWWLVARLERYEAARLMRTLHNVWPRNFFGSGFEREFSVDPSTLLSWRNLTCMTVFAQLDAIASIPAFKTCSEAGLERIKTEGSLVRFSIGHALSDHSIIPNRILLLLSGKARLLGNHNGQLNTLAVLGPGNLVGLPSLLRAEGCEEVSAATAVEAWALPDTLIADLYNSETSFRTWCDSTVFPAELASLINTLLNQSERAPFGLLDVLAKVMPTARALEATADAVRSISEAEQAFVGSANSSATLNTELEAADGLPSSEGTFALRLLSLPRAVVDQIRAGQNTADGSQHHSDEQDDPERRPMASVNCQAVPAST